MFLKKRLFNFNNQKDIKILGSFILYWKTIERWIRECMEPSTMGGSYEY